MTDAQELLQKQLQELRRLYLAALPEKIKHLEVSFLRYKTDEAIGLMDFYRAAHTLAGSASIYSMSAVSDIVRQIEHLVSPIIKGGAGSANWRRDVEVLLEKLKAIAPTLT